MVFLLDYDPSTLTRALFAGYNTIRVQIESVGVAYREMISRFGPTYYHTHKINSFKLALKAGGLLCPLTKLNKFLSTFQENPKKVGLTS